MDRSQQHDILICAQHPEAFFGLAAALQAEGCAVTALGSLRAATRHLRQSLPHVVICDAALDDGKVAQLIRVMHQHPALRWTPLIVRGSLDERRVTAITRLLPRFQGCWPLRRPTSGLFGLVQAALAALPRGTPYAVETSLDELVVGTALSVDVEVLGLHDGHLAVATPCNIDVAALATLVPRAPGRAPAQLRAARCQQLRGQQIAYFPLHRVRGRGLRWLRQLEPMPDAGARAQPEGPLILVYDPLPERFVQLRAILGGYGFRLEHAMTLASAALRLEPEPERYAGVFFHELPRDGSALAWRRVYEGLPEPLRPPLLVATAVRRSKAPAKQHWLVRPFGMGMLVDSLRAMLVQAQVPMRGLRQHVDAALQLPCQIVALDERGGVLRSAAPLPDAARARLLLPALGSAWAEPPLFRVGNGRPSRAVPGTWEADFAPLLEGAARSAYFKRVLEALPANALAGHSFGPGAKATASVSVALTGGAGEAGLLRSQVLNALIQALALVFGYYLGSTPAMHKAQKRADARALGYGTALARVRGRGLAMTLALSASEGLLAMMGPRVSRRRWRKGKLDAAAALETTEVLADQILFQMELLLGESIAALVVDLDDVTVGRAAPLGWTDGMILPFTVEGHAFVLEFPSAQASAANTLRQAG